MALFLGSQISFFVPTFKMHRFHMKIGISGLSSKVRKSATLSLHFQMTSTSASWAAVTSFTGTWTPIGYTVVTHLYCLASPTGCFTQLNCWHGTWIHLHLSIYCSIDLYLERSILLKLLLLLFKNRVMLKGQVGIFSLPWLFYIFS